MAHGGYDHDDGDDGYDGVCYWCLNSFPKKQNECGAIKCRSNPTERPGRMTKEMLAYMCRCSNDCRDCCAYAHT